MIIKHIKTTKEIHKFIKSNITHRSTDIGLLVKMNELSSISFPYSAVQDRIFVNNGATTIMFEGLQWVLIQKKPIKNTYLSKLIEIESIIDNKSNNKSIALTLIQALRISGMNRKIDNYAFLNTREAKKLLEYIISSSVLDYICESKGQARETIEILENKANSAMPIYIKSNNGDRRERSYSNELKINYEDLEKCLSM